MLGHNYKLCIANSGVMQCESYSNSSISFSLFQYFKYSSPANGLDSASKKFRKTYGPPPPPPPPHNATHMAFMNIDRSTSSWNVVSQTGSAQNIASTSSNSNQQHLYDLPNSKWYFFNNHLILIRSSAVSPQVVSDELSGVGLFETTGLFAHT